MALRDDIPEVGQTFEMSDDEAFWLAVLDRLNSAHVSPEVFQQAVEPALEWFANQDLAELEDSPREVGLNKNPPLGLHRAQQEALLRIMAASTAMDLLERLALGLPKQTSLRLSLVFLRVGIANKAGRRITISDILLEDAKGHSPSPGWPEGKNGPTLRASTIRNSYLGLESAGLLTTERGEDREGRNQYLRLTEDGMTLFERVVSAVRLSRPDLGARR